MSLQQPSFKRESPTEEVKDESDLFADAFSSKYYDYELQTNNNNNPMAFLGLQQQELLPSLQKETADSRNSISIEQPWYLSHEKLAFDCTGCGKCCKTKGDVFLDPKETTAAANFLNMTVDKFMHEYVQQAQVMAERK